MPQPSCCTAVAPPVTAAVFAPQEPWASDVGMVRDYMYSYLKDGSSDAADPSFQLDEVGGPVRHLPGKTSSFPASPHLSASTPSSSPTSSPRRTW